MILRLRHASPQVWLVALASSACTGMSSTKTPLAFVTAAADGRAWVAGDHHIHSEFSADYPGIAPGTTVAPEPVLGADGRYSIPMNAWLAPQYGLGWMVAPDHGGPNHSQLNFEQP